MVRFGFVNTVLFSGGRSGQCDSLRIWDFVPVCTRRVEGIVEEMAARASLRAVCVLGE
jgi:hypothetical protein